ncbi:hypothetical protein GQ600_3682 [Phytophthora cactorum]|nr:hypothetical protein GQ600_3682 [Phytophthora cactorum]
MELSHDASPFLAGLTLIVVSIVHATGSDVPLPSASSSEGFRIASDATITGTRLLRCNSAGDASDETRAGLSVPDTEKLKSWFTSSEVTPERLQSWLNKGKSADTVFTRMHLKKAGHWTLQAPQFSTWLQYVDNMNARTSPKSTSAISTLTRQFGADELYGMIESAKFIPEIKNLATRLETDQRVGHVQYVDDVNAKHPEDPVHMISTLHKYFKDDRLLAMMETAKRAKTIATKVEDDLLQDWLKSRKTPHDALVGLGLGNTMNSILEKPLLNTWANYIDAYNSRYQEKKTTMIEMLTRKFNDVRVATALTAAKSKDTTKRIASKLESAQLEMWKSHGESKDDVYEMLNLYAWSLDFSNNPLLSTWVSYMNTIITDNPSKLSTLISTLETRFNDRPLLQILERANKFLRMESAAAKLQTEKMQTIFASNISPKEAFHVLGLDTMGDSVLSSTVLKEWKVM